MRYFDLIKQLFYKLDKKGLTKTDNAPKIKKTILTKKYSNDMNNFCSCSCFKT